MFLTHLNDMRNHQNILRSLIINFIPSSNWYKPGYKDLYIEYEMDSIAVSINKELTWRYEDSGDRSIFQIATLVTDYQ